MEERGSYSAYAPRRQLDPCNAATPHNGCSVPHGRHRVREQLGLDARLRSAVVLFFNKDRTRCKLLFHDGSGVVILYKRLDRAHFHVPSIVRAGDRSVRIEARELGVLLAGIERR
jgi:hypothetical protein